MHKKNIVNKNIKTFLNNIFASFIVLTIISLLFTSCSNTSKTPTPSKAPETTENKAVQDKYIKAGMYKAGPDISAGEYLLYSEGGSAYFQVSKDSSGSLESIITNDNFQGTRYVTVKDGQYIELKSSKMLPVNEAPVQEPQSGQYKDGMYKVGRDIKAGEYKVVASGSTAYYEVASNSGGGIESIVSNDNFEGEKYITLKDGQYIKLNGCSIPAK
jgi:hypothetical protein